MARMKNTGVLILRVAAPLGFLLLSGLQSAWAVNPLLCSPAQPAECENGLSTPVTSLDALRVRAQVPAGQRAEEEEKASAKQARLPPIRVATTGDTAGLLGKDAASGWGLWTNYGQANFAGTRPQVPYESRLDSLTFGIDKSFFERVTAGLALTGETQEIVTRYNYGGQKVRGFTYAPYVSVLLNDYFSVDLNAGEGRLDVLQRRLAPDSVANAPVYLFGNYKATRKFWTATLNGFISRGDWTLGGRLGHIDSREKQPGYTETDPVNGSIRDRTVTVRDVKLVQFFSGVDVSWGFHRDWQLYGSYLERRDLSRDSGRSAGGLPGTVSAAIEPTDISEAEGVVGLRFYGSRGITISAEWLRTVGRDFFKNDTVGVTGRIEF